MTSILALLLTSSACGYSPLLNHTNPVRVSENAPMRTESELTCRLEFQSQTLCADFIWVKEPRGSDEGAMKVYFWHKDQPGTYADLGTLQLGVKLWMPDMGHGSQKVKVDSAKDPNGQSLPGIYDAAEVMFVMSGEWEIHFQLKDSTGKIVEMQKILYQAQ